jgi:hypothetical protein
VKPADIRRWVEQRRLAERREQQESAGKVPPPAEAFARGLRMIALAGELHGWPLPEDESSRLEDHQAYARWARLRARLTP